MLDRPFLKAFPTSLSRKECLQEHSFCFAPKSLVTVVMPHNLLDLAMSLPNLPKRGVYYLLEENRGVIRRVYAGQTVKGFSRFASHKAKKTWWNLAILHLDTDQHIDKELLDMLEALQIDHIRSHGDYEADNTNTPHVKIDPYKEERLHALHETILFRMKVLGWDLETCNKQGKHDNSNDRLRIRRKKVSAFGSYNPQTGNFVVHAGSEILCGKPPLNNKLVSKKRLELFGASKQAQILKSDTSFSSPSTAAEFVLGGSQNGWDEWVGEDGRKLKELYPRHKA